MFDQHETLLFLFIRRVLGSLSCLVESIPVGLELDDCGDKLFMYVNDCGDELTMCATKFCFFSDEFIHVACTKVAHDRITATILSFLSIENLFLRANRDEEKYGQIHLCSI